MRTQPTPCRFRAWRAAPGPITVNPRIVMALLAAGFATGCEAIFSGEEEGVGTVTVFGLNDITYPSFGSARRADTIRVERSVVVR